MTKHAQRNPAMPSGNTAKRILVCLARTGAVPSASHLRRLHRSRRRWAARDYRS